MENIKQFLDTENEVQESLYKTVAHDSWMSNTTGLQEWVDRKNDSLKDYFYHFANRDLFERIQKFRNDMSLSHIQRRQLDDIYLKMVKNMLSKEESARTLELENEISKIFNTYRPTIDGKETTNNAILHILKESKDNVERKKTWLSSKQIGKMLEKKILELVNRRNQNAKTLGFANFYEMSFQTQELDIDVVFDIFTKLRNVTDAPFRSIKLEIDQEISEKLHIQQDEIRPWHYIDPFFQEAPPPNGKIDFDSYYKEKNLEEIARNTFAAMGLDISGIFENSDLYPRKNKNPFGFCSDLDRSGDVRILVNLESNQYWAKALLHELGHAVYTKYIDKELPFILRTDSHTLTTEASALFFGRLTKNAEWYRRFLLVNEEQIIPLMKKYFQREMLVSARWFITFSMFEKELYENPNQDLNKLWWKLVQDIQFVHPPEDTSHPDWASKMHFSLAPVSYQNYLLGELTASQLQHHIETQISDDLFTSEVGKYLKEQFYHSGSTYRWNEKIKMATGEELNPNYFIKQLLL